MIDFKRLNEKKVAVHFKTREEMQEFLEECDKHEIRWRNGDKASEKDYFDRYSDFCIEAYDSCLGYAGSCSYLSRGYSIIEYQDLIHKNVFGEVDRIVTNKDTMIVFWDDGTKTLVKKGQGEKDNKELAFLYAYFQKHSGLSKTMSNKIVRELIGNIHNQDIPRKKKGLK